jgi:hypothetical protein
MILPVIDKAFELGNGKPVFIQHVPVELQRDLLSFIEGRTLAQYENQWAVFPQDYREWLKKLFLKGLDYDLPSTHVN